VEHQRARLNTLLSANREIVAAAARMRAEVAEQRRKRLAATPRPPAP
jgi:hypothetical protein